MTGKFITFEGSEGSGKSTQARLLCGYLRQKGLAVILLREPGSTPIGEKIRKVLLDPVNKKMTLVTEMFLYMVARAQLVEEVIKPALKKGKFVVCDRFLDATLAYQGYGAGLDLGLIRRIGALATQGIKPDLTFLMDILPEEGLRRVGRNKDRIEQRKISFHRRVRRGYFALARKEPKRIKIIPVQKLRNHTQELIRSYVGELL